MEKEQTLPSILVRPNALGGMPQAGAGWHPDENAYWQTPRFEVHPLTLREEAVEGIFFRFWPEHVAILQVMRERGWPPHEILRVAKEFRKRQDEQDQRDMDLIKQHQEAQHAQDTSATTQIYGVGQSDNAQQPQDVGQPPQQASPAFPIEKALALLKSLSLLPDADYRRAVAQYQKMSQQKARAQRPDLSLGVLKKAELGASPMFQIKIRGEGDSHKKSITEATQTGQQEQEVSKGDGELALNPMERKRAKEQSFTHKEVGVGNAAYTAPQDRPSKREVPQVEDMAVGIRR